MSLENSELGLVGVLKEGSDKDSVGFVWLKGDGYRLQSTDADAVRTWNHNTRSVFYLTSDDSDRGLRIWVRSPETTQEWLSAIETSLSGGSYWIDVPREISKAWTPEAREASLETRRRRMADREAIAKVRRERSQPYPHAGIEKANEVTEYISKGAPIDYSKQVLAGLPSKDLEAADIDSIIVHGPNSWDRFSSLAHLKNKEGGVLTLIPKSVTGEKHGPEAIKCEINLNGSASGKAQRLAILMAVGRQQLANLDPIDARRIYDLFGKDRSGFSKRYMADYAMYATGEGSRAKLAAKEPNIYSYFKHHFGSSEKSLRSEFTKLFMG